MVNPMTLFNKVPKRVFEEGSAPKGEYRITFEDKGHKVTEMKGLSEKNLRFIGKALDSAFFNTYTVHQVIRT